MRKNLTILFTIIIVTIVFGVENLNRGLIAMPKSDGTVYVGWRMFESDPLDITFNVYRQTPTTDAVVVGTVETTTDFFDLNPPAGEKGYFISAHGTGITREISESIWITANQQAQSYISIPRTVGTPAFMQPTIGDLDGDGDFEFVLKSPDSFLMPDESSWHKDDRTFTLYAYQGDGSLMWQANLTHAIEVGPWYSPHLAYDFDGDGKAEVALKSWLTINEPYEPERDNEGRVIEEEEYLSILDGGTGEIIAQTGWLSRDDFEGPNHVSRNLMGVAYLDGVTPSIIIVRGTYGLIKMAAFNFTGNSLDKQWEWVSTQEEQPGYHGDGSRNGSGSHFIHAADVDNDGRDEVIYGSFVLDDDGHGLWALDRTDNGTTSPGGHPDGHFVGDIDLNHEGLEIYYQFEKWQNKNGMCLVDAATGQLLWGLNEKSGHFHRAGLCADISALHPGLECYGKDDELSTDTDSHAWLISSDGSIIKSGDNQNWGSQPWTVYWDADVQREVISGNKVTNFPENETLLTMLNCDRTIMVADIWGDWREEIIRSTNQNEIRVYTSTIPAKDRRPSLTNDHIYRIDVANNAMGYAQAPMVSREFVENSHINTAVSKRLPQPNTFNLVVSPNPFFTSAVLCAPEHAKIVNPINIYTITGQLVKTLRFTKNKGVWDGTNAQGFPVPAGIYIVKVESEHNQYFTKITRLH